MAVNSQIAFAPLGNTIAITAANPSPSGVQAPLSAQNSAHDAGQIRVVNSSNNIIHLGIGATAASAQTNAAAAAAGSPAAGIPLLSGAVEILRVAPGSFFSGFASGASTLFITPGQGL